MLGQPVAHQLPREREREQGGEAGATAMRAREGKAGAVGATPDLGRTIAGTTTESGEAEGDKSP